MLRSSGLYLRNPPLGAPTRLNGLDQMRDRSQRLSNPAHRRGIHLWPVVPECRRTGFEERGDVTRLVFPDQNLAPDFRNSNRFLTFPARKISGVAEPQRAPGAHFQGRNQRE